MILPTTPSLQIGEISSRDESNSSKDHTRAAAAAAAAKSLQSCPTLCNARLPCPSLSPGICSNSCRLSW